MKKVITTLLILASFLYVDVFATPISPLPNTDYAIVLIRHAERKIDDDLTINGKRRARKLAQMLKDININKVYSTNYKRTKKTVDPLSKSQKLKVEIYDNSQALYMQLAQDLTSENQNIVIVGHSNTVPELIYLLSGQTVKEIPEDEFDNLYILHHINGKTKLVHLHY